MLFGTKKPLRDDDFESRIKILGAGCDSCENLDKVVKEALEELGIDIEIQHIRKFETIAKYRVMSTPALIVDDEIISCGRNLNVNQVKDVLKNFKA